MQRVRVRGVPRVGGGFGLVRSGAAELFEHPQAAGPEAAGTEQCRDLHGGAGPRAEDEEAAAGVEGRGDPGEGAPHDGDDVHVLAGPAEAGARVGDGGGVRQDADGVGAEESGEGPADPVEHRVAAREDDACAPVVRGEQSGERRAQRRGPGDADGGALGGQQVQLAGAAEDHVGRAQDGAGRLGDTGPALGADTDDGDGVLRGGAGAAVTCAVLGLGSGLVPAQPTGV
ncbi:hypothetical protein GA0115246_102254 [Streptomyces sp. SolWspMP-sol7th]|nr:hypothetical protein GA0115246_102254 [Streptomyces sp. SolWspMP-sol7th]